MPYLFKTSLAIFLCYLTGCVAVDSRVSELRAKRFPTDGIAVTFANRPIYISKEGLLKGIDDFADVLGLYAYRGRPRADFIILRWVDTVGLTIQLTKEEKPLFEKTYRLGEEMAFTEEGKILLKPKHDWHSGGGYAGAYEKKQFALFIDDDDNLVVVESSDSLSLLLVVPVPGHWRLISIFPQIQPPTTPQGIGSHGTGRR